MPSSPTRWSFAWLLAGSGSLAGGWLVHRYGVQYLPTPGLVVALCFALAALQIAGGVAGHPVRVRLTPLLAAGRLALPLVTLSIWAGEGRELWGALVVWIAWRDAQRGLSRAHPLLPVGAALALALANNAWHPGPPAARAVLVGLVAALAAANAREAPTDPVS